jgi:cytochrome P450
MTYLSFFLKEGTVSKIQDLRAFTDDIDLEVLRLYPSVPINSRTSLRTTTLPVGGGIDGASPVRLEKGQAVGYCVYAMHRRTDLYGADAKQFRPERWDPNNRNNEVSLQNIGWGYLPFNGGPRICLGRKSLPPIPEE